MGKKSQKPQLHVPMTDAALKRLDSEARARDFKSTAAFVRSVLADTIPDLKPEFDQLEWGGIRSDSPAPPRT